MHLTCPKSSRTARYQSNLLSRPNPRCPGEGRHHAEGTLRLQHGRRLLPGELPAAHELLGKDRRPNGPAQGRQASASRKKAGRSSMGIVTSPANHAKLAHYQNIARRLARADGVSQAEARRAGRRRQSGRLDRRRPARQRSRSVPRCSSRRSTNSSRPTTPRRSASSTTSSSSSSTPIPTAWTWSPTGT